MKTVTNNDIVINKRGTDRNGYVIIMELDGEGDRWLRLHGNPDRLVYDLSKYR